MDTNNSKSTDNATQTDNTLQIEDIKKTLKGIYDNIKSLHQELQQFSINRL